MAGPVIERGGGQFIAADAREAAYVPSPSWDPWFGRMGGYLRNRHAELGEAVASEPIWTETFDSFRPDAPPPWEVIGEPGLRVLTEAGRGNCLQIDAPPGPGLHGIQREVAADRVRGRLVRVRVRTRQTSAARARNLGTPQMRWLVATGDGQKHIASLPLIGRASPGWEAQEFVTYFEPAAKRVWLQLVHVNTSCPFDFDDVVVERVSSDSFARPVTADGESPGPGVDRVPTAAPNLVPNGNFEVGPKGFSVWSRREWPGRGRYAAPQYWYFDSDAMVGQVSLAVPLTGVEANVCLGPFGLTAAGGRERPAERYHLSFYAKASDAIDIEVDWRIAGLPASTARFRVGTEWTRQRHLYLTPVTVLDGDAGTAAELTFRVPATTEADHRMLWLDGVAFGASRTSETFAPPAAVEIGLFGPAPDPTDVGELLQLGEPAAFAVRLANYADRPYGGTVAIDLLDAFDRPVWTKTTQPQAAAESTWNDQVVLRLPRGYYRAKATAWSGSIGVSSILSRDERAMAVIDLADPVPRTGFFGMAADAGSLSARTTQIGTGWVTMPLNAAWCAGGAGRSPFGGWTAATEHCGAQDLNVVARLSNLPRDAARRRTFCAEWLAASGSDVAAVHVDRDEASEARADKPTRLPAAIRRWLGTASSRPAVVVGVSADDWPPTTTAPLSQPATSAARVPASRPTSAPTSMSTMRADGFAIRCLALPMMPEDAETQLDAWGRRRPLAATASWWDLSVVGCAGSAYSRRAAVTTNPGSPVCVQTEGADPLRSASCLVRGMLIRHLANVDFACSTVSAFRPIETLAEPPPSGAMTEYDHSPRPALAAWDWMTVLMNNATPIRWFDKPSDVRGIAFERDDGQTVVAVWRPFGRTQQRLVLPGFAGRAVVYDLFGRPEPDAKAGADLVVRIDELVRYVVSAPEAREALPAAVAAAEPLVGP